MEKRCNRKVQRNKYEHNAPEILNWWHELFDILEFDASIPPDKRLSLLEEVFPSRVLDRILSILSIQREKYEPNRTLQTERVKTPRRSKKYKVGSEASLIPDSVQSVCDARDMKLCVEQMKSSASDIVFKKFGAEPPVKANPYLNFFKRRPDRAAIWRELPPLSLEEMNLNQKAEAITEAIAKDFVNWIKTLGGDEETSLNVQSVIEMFEIGFQTNSATSLCVQLKELPSVPHKVAEFLKQPSMSRTAILHREIMRDHNATKLKPKIVAFGRRLPTDLQVKPPAKNFYKKWLHCERVPEKLETMAAVWQGITHLRSTRAFCEFIFTEKENVKPPKYLIDAGMMDPKTLFSARKSVEVESDENSFGNKSRLASLFPA